GGRPRATSWRASGDGPGRRRRLDVQAALGLVAARPAALAAGAGLRARGTADRLIALVVERVIREVAVVDAAAEVLLGPLGQRVELPDPALVVELDVLGRGARRALLAAQPGDPGVDAAQRLLQGRDLGGRAAVLGAGPVTHGIKDFHFQAK